MNKIYLITLLLSMQLFALNCTELKDLKQYNGHYYAITNNTFTFDEAKKYSEDNSGYLAIPNSSNENAYLKTLTGGGDGAWIGVYDSSYSSNYCYSTSSCTVYSNYKDIKNNSLSYTNWDVNEPNNYVHPYDVSYGKQLVSPLGEHWAVLNGNNGKWYDFGNHVNNNNNPARYRALIEFDTQPTCYDVPTNVVDTFTNAKCNTQVYDNTTNILQTGTTFDCKTDIYNNNYCPAALSQCAQQFDYDNGYSISGIGQVTDYSKKISDTNIQNVSSTCQRSTGGIIPENPSGQWYSYVPAWAGSNGAGWQVYINKVGPTTYKIYYRLEAYYRWTGWKTAYAEEGTVFQDYYYNRGDYGGFKVDLKTAVLYGLHPKTLGEVAIGDLENMPVCKSCGSFLPATELTQTTLSNLGGSGWILSTYLGGSTVNIEVSSDKNRYYYKIQAGNGTAKIGTGSLTGTITDSSYYNDGKWDYSINFELTSSFIRIGQWGGYSQVYKFNDLVCFSNSLNCGPNYVETVGAETLNGECKRTQEYTYYTYICNNSVNSQGYNFVPTTTGGNTGKTDPNNTAINDLTSPLNSSTPPTNNCKRQKFTCQANSDRPCSLVDNTWQCSPFPCIGGNDVTPLGSIEGSNDKKNDGWNESGGCSGQIYIFNGSDKRCRDWDMFFGLTGGGCCDKEKVFAGIIACKDNEKALAKLSKSEQCHEIGEYCSKQAKLGITKICVQKSKSNCCFGSKLARAIPEQGRPQINMSWGSAELPNCRGFKPEEFQKLDFSKIDLTGTFDIPNLNQTQLNTTINNTITNFKNMLGK